MFFRSKHNASYRLQTQFEMKSASAGVQHVYMLPNGYVLSIGRVSGNASPKMLRLFNPKTKIKIAECTMPIGDALVTPLSKKYFLLNDHDKLSILSSENLSLVENLQEKIPHFYRGCSIANSQFLTVDKYVRPNTKLSLIKHDCESKIFHQQVSLPFEIMLDKDDISNDYSCTTGNLIKLDNGQIAFPVLGHNTDYFKVFVLNTKSENEFELSHTLQPKTWRSIDSLASGKIASLPNGRLLTYHPSGHHFQVWDGNNCINEWNWTDANIHCADKDFFNWTSDVAALPDGDHLLVQLGMKLFLFNMQTNQLQKVDVGNLDVWEFCMDAQGQVIVSTADKSLRQNTLLAIDFADTADYRKNISTILSEKIRKDPGSIVKSYVGYEDLWVKDEIVPEKGKCAIS